jgi:hypothetical protein
VQVHLAPVPRQRRSESRPRTPSRKSCLPWGYPPVRPNSGPHDLHPRNPVATVETGSTDRTSTRVRWSRLPCVFEKAPSGPRNPLKRAAPMRPGPR